MYFGVMSSFPALPPQIYVSAARGLIFQPGGRSCLSSAMSASISVAYSTSAGARRMPPLPFVSAEPSAAVAFLAMVILNEKEKDDRESGAVLQLREVIEQLIDGL